MRKLIILLCMILTVALVSAQPLDIRDPSIGGMYIRDAYPGMVFTDGEHTYYIADVDKDILMSTSVCRVDGRLCLFQVLTYTGGTDLFYQVVGVISLFGGLRPSKPMEIMYKETEDGKLYSGVMYMPIEAQVDTSSTYPTITYVYELKPGVDESWCTIMMWQMDGTMLYSGIIGEL